VFVPLSPSVEARRTTVPSATSGSAADALSSVPPRAAYARHDDRDPSHDDADKRDRADKASYNGRMQANRSVTGVRSRAIATAIVAVVPFVVGCRKLASMALDRALGSDGGSELLSGAASTGHVDACALVTVAEIEAASGKKVQKTDPGDNTCGWALIGPTSGAGGIAAMAGNNASISLQIVPEVAMKIIPVLGAQKAIPGLGDHAEWSGGMAPNLRVHVKGGQVLNFLFVDPELMMKNPGITETPVKRATTKTPSGTSTTTVSAVNMEYPELEKEAVAIARAAVGRL
jgi:hypothetical protein